MAEVTEILRSIEQGDRKAASDLLPLVYDELRKLAAARMARETSDQTLDATGLVHEAYVRLVDPDVDKPDAGDRLQWDSRGHFFSAAAEAMRRILVENARRKRSLKRGGDLNRRELSDLDVAAPEPSDQVLAVSDALDRLETVDGEAAQLIKLRYFAGLSISDAAKVLGMSSRSADRVWAYARSWIHQAIVDPS